MTELVNGKIPANTKCPYQAKCVAKQDDTCGHRGVEHPVSYSCGFARAFKIFSTSSAAPELTDEQMIERLNECDHGRSPTSARSYMVMGASRLIQLTTKDTA